MSEQFWENEAARFCRNADFYRSVIDECAKHLGPEAYTADDGTVMDEPVRLKVPEMVAALRARVAELEAALREERLDTHSDDCLREEDPFRNPCTCAYAQRDEARGLVLRGSKP